MKRHLHLVLNYFGYFLYAPSFDEIYTFFPRKIGKKDLKKFLFKEIRGKTLISIPNPRATSHPTYTLPQYSIRMNQKSKIKNKNKHEWPARTIQTYLSILKWLPFVRFVGITGATAMNGYSSHDDVDLFIITQSEALWTTRFFVVLLAKLLGIYGGFGVCLNLFFDEVHLTIPKIKCNSYVAHEILQMKPIIDKNFLYRRFLAVNGWIYHYFPNAKRAQSLKLKAEKFQVSPLRQGFKGQASYKLQKTIDHIFKSIQLPIIHRNRTGFIITPTQLWLFKRDFEKKINRKGLML